MSDNPFRCQSKPWWRREAEDACTKVSELRRTNATLRELLTDSSALNLELLPPCACKCHDDDGHCDSCCWPPQTGCCPDCVSYMLEPIP